MTIPTDCHDLVNAEVYAALFGETPLNDPAVVGPDEADAVEPTAPPAGASAEETLSSATQLRCIWRDPGADVTYLETSVATVDHDVAAQYLAGLPAEGYTCTESNAGEQCQLVKPNDMYPVDEGYTHFLRDDIYVYVGQANYPTDNQLMDAVVATLWG